MGIPLLVLSDSSHVVESGAVWLKLMVDAVLEVMALSMFGESRFFTEV
jgi:hypothetical protein